MGELTDVGLGVVLLNGVVPAVSLTDGHFEGSLDHSHLDFPHFPLAYVLLKVESCLYLFLGHCSQLFMVEPSIGLIAEALCGPLLPLQDLPDHFLHQ